MQSFSQLCIECFLWIHISPGIYLFSCHGFHYGYWLCFASVLSVWFCKDRQMSSVVSHTVGYLKCWGRPIICLTATLIYCDLVYSEIKWLWFAPVCHTHMLYTPDRLLLTTVQCKAIHLWWTNVETMKNISDSWLLLLILLSYYSTTNNLSIYTMTVDVLCCKQKCMYIYALLLMFLKMILFGLICI